MDDKFVPTENEAQTNEELDNILNDARHDALANSAAEHEANDKATEENEAKTETDEEANTDDNS